MKKIHPLLLSVISGSLLFAAWPVSPLTLLIFVAWVPLLFIEQQGLSKLKFFYFTYLVLFIWNASTTWWIWNASAPGAIGAILTNSLLMTIPWLGFYSTKKRFGGKIGYLSLIIYWLTFEYIHLQDWGLSWPWLTLGNVFSTHPQWIQWYSITGSSGGSLWVMMVNILLFQSFTQFKNQKLTTRGKNIVFCLGIAALPILLSLVMNIHGKVVTSKENIVIVQPNIDPYEKISAGTFTSQIQKLISLSEQEIDDNTALVIWPETALYTENGIDENNMKGNNLLQPLWNFLQKHPNIKLFSGVESYRLFDKKTSVNARAIPGSDFFYEAYNGSALLDSSGPLQFYHKSMLVPGVETLPWFLKFIDRWFEKFGGTTAGYTKQADRTVITDNKNGYKIAPAICYESIYGEYMSKYIRNGANIIAIITNDGWWGNTPGYRQHMNYARIRAIETRRWVVRSANTGISCIINESGNVIKEQPWDKAATIKYGVPQNNTTTIFTYLGDLISKAALVLTVLLLIWIFYDFIRKKQTIAKAN
ncbi:MAG TPA: apolipoprotein N-acyltransferase [Chitinophagaceae bacterium]|nr:apolipoprotein N-acyltransferase [Chitinophagaceae bacterium]